MEDEEFYKLFKYIVRLKELTSTEKIVLSVIASYTSVGLEFYMGNATLGMETGLNTATTYRVISSLEEKGYIKLFKKRGVGRSIKVLRNNKYKYIYDGAEEEKEFF